MNVTLEDSCWARHDQGWSLSLSLLLVELAQHPHHQLSADAVLLREWCRERIPTFSDLLETRLISSNLRSKSIDIRVTPEGKDAVLGPPPWTLMPDATRTLVEAPLQLYLENDESDWGFISAVDRRAGDLLSRKSLQKFHGGGSDMTKKIEKAGGDAVLRWRTFFMFDSDRLHPDELHPDWTTPRGDGCQGLEFAKACREQNLSSASWHMLRRRSIENYLPTALLTELSPACTETLLSASVGNMRHHYNMKFGLEGDGIWPQNPDKLNRASRTRGAWDALSADDKQRLRTGYGKKVAEQFKDVPSEHRWEPEVIDEVGKIIEALLDAV